MMTLTCHSGSGREKITASPTWLSLTFSSRQIERLRAGKTVRKGPVNDRKVYWYPRIQTRKKAS